jgi:hypothetical protein
VQGVHRGGHALTAQQTVLLVGGTGRTGRRALAQLLARGDAVASCLGHTFSLKRAQGPPYDLV